MYLKIIYYNSATEPYQGQTLIHVFGTFKQDKTLNSYTILFGQLAFHHGAELKKTTSVSIPNQLEHDRFTYLQHVLRPPIILILLPLYSDLRSVDHFTPFSSSKANLVFALIPLFLVKAMGRYCDKDSNKRFSIERDCKKTNGLD